MSTIRRLRFSVIAVLAVPVLLILSGTSARSGALPRGMVTFTFDDACVSTYSIAFPILREFGIPATAYAPSDYIGTHKKHFNWENAWEMQAAGWEIGNHTRSHNNVTTMSDAELIADLKSSMSKLRSHGMNVTSIAPPYGACNARTLKIIGDSGFFSSLRSFSACAPLPILQSPEDFRRWRIRVLAIMPTTEIEAVFKLIDDAVAQKKWLVFGFHDVVDGEISYDNRWQITADMLRQIAGHVAIRMAEGGIDAVTITRGVSEMIWQRGRPADPVE